MRLKYKKLIHKSEKLDLCCCVCVLHTVQNETVLEDAL